MRNPLIPTAKVILDKERTIRFGMYELCRLQATKLFGPNILQFLLDAFAKIAAAVQSNDSQLRRLIGKMEKGTVEASDIMGIDLPLDIEQIRALIWVSLIKEDPALTLDDVSELAPFAETLKVLGPIMQIITASFGAAGNGAKPRPFEEAVPTSP